MVYKCRDKNNDECCVKRIELILAPNSMPNKTHLHSIQQEIYLLQNLDHPRIISLYSFFYSDDKKFIHIVMEYATLGPLSKLLAQKVAENGIFNETVCIYFIIFFIIL